jgi:hypothetical protein
MNLYEIEKQHLFEEEIKVTSSKKESSSEDDDDTESEYDFNDNDDDDEKKEIYEDNEVQVMEMFDKIESEIKSQKYTFDRYLVIQE